MAPTTNASPRAFRPKFVSRMVGVGYLLMLASGFDLFYVLGEVLLVLWLAVRGVDEEHWHEQAGSNLRAYGQSA